MLCRAASSGGGRRSWRRLPHGGAVPLLADAQRTVPQTSKRHQKSGSTSSSSPPPPPPPTHYFHLLLPSLAAQESDGASSAVRQRQQRQPGANHGRRLVRSQVGPPVAVGPDSSPHGAAGADADRVELQQPRLRRRRGERGLQRAGEEGPGRRQQSRRRRLFPARDPTAAASSSAGEEGISSHTAAGKAEACFSHSYRVPRSTMERLVTRGVEGRSKHT